MLLTKKEHLKNFQIVLIKTRFDKIYSFFIESNFEASLMILSILYLESNKKAAIV